MSRCVQLLPADILPCKVLALLTKEIKGEELCSIYVRVQYVCAFVSKMECRLPTVYLYYMFCTVKCSRTPKQIPEISISCIILVILHEIDLNYAKLSAKILIWLNICV